MEDEITLCNPILKKRIIKCISKDNKCYIFMGSNTIVRKLLITLKSNITFQTIIENIFHLMDIFDIYGYSKISLTNIF